ncbi:MAG: MBL fold metallo-hydrolase [Clostridia bacterium]|nr:MBL fold metallo-hydrolase [Clostridia bacterium]
MKAIWLGQAGILLSCGEKTIIIDPYLSDSVVKAEPKNFRRKPIDESFLAIEPDVLVFTHDHLDHYDPETAPVYFAKEKNMTVLCPTSVWNKARQYKNGHNYVQFNRYSEWTEGDLRFSAVKAEHSDPYAIGVIIEELSTGIKLYVTGDTLYNKEIFDDLPDDIYAVFLPINGVGNNMNATDAARFARRSGARKAVPIHFGMFDELDPRSFVCRGRVIPTIYEEIEL